jgi:hypothetical protein
MEKLEIKITNLRFVVTNFHTSGIQMIKVLLELYDLLNFKLKEIINGLCPNDQSQP